MTAGTEKGGAPGVPNVWVSGAPFEDPAKAIRTAAVAAVTARRRPPTRVRPWCRVRCGILYLPELTGHANTAQSVDLGVDGSLVTAAAASVEQAQRRWTVRRSPAGSRRSPDAAWSAGPERLAPAGRSRCG